MKSEYFILIFLNILFDSKVLISGKYISTLKNENINNNEKLIIRKLEEVNTHDSYIVIYFKGDCNYKEFHNIYRKSISFIINKENNEKLTSKNSFELHKGFGLEIHFNTSIKNLEYFFSKGLDENMHYLISIDFTKFDSSLVTRMNNMFYGCSSLESIILSNSDISNVESMKLMFYGCSSLQTIDLSNLKASKLDDMSDMFRECKSLKTVNFSNFECPLIFYMSNIFFDCTSLESVDFTNFHTPLLFDMYKMFYGCSSLKSINLSDFDTSQVSIMNNMFYGCDSLRAIDLSNFDMKECTSYDDIFSNIDNIRYINLYNFKNDKIMSQIFKDAKNLFFVCQKYYIIINPHAYNCCDFNYETDKCDSYEIIDETHIDGYPNSTKEPEDHNYANGTNPVSNKSNSSSKLSISLIIGIISGAIVIICIIIIIIIIFCICKKRKNNYNEADTTAVHLNYINSTENINSYTYDSKADKNNNISVTIITTNNLKTIVFISPNKKLCDLIKYYFDMIKRQELFNDPKIRFIINSNVISHDSEDLISKYMQNDNKKITILVDDLEDKIIKK